MVNSNCLQSLIVLSSILSVSIAQGAAGAPFEMDLWHGTAPGSENSQLEELTTDREVTDGTDVKHDRHVKGVRKPTMMVYLADAAQATGAAVAVIPGGGFNVLAIDKEGHDIARWLNEQGVAGIVVKYRLPDLATGVHVRNASLPDIQRAIRLIRANASEWGIDSRRVGVVGFSAGGFLTAAAGTMFDEGNQQATDPVERFSCRPDFLTPVYPLVSLNLEASRGEAFLQRILGINYTTEDLQAFSPDQRVTSGTPPTLLVHADDDRLSSQHSTNFYLALKKAGVRAELHLYSQGGHGYGIRQRGLPVSSWHLRWLAWLDSEGFLGGE